MKVTVNKGKWYDGTYEVSERELRIVSGLIYCGPLYPTVSVRSCKRKELEDMEDRGLIGWEREDGWCPTTKGEAVCYAAKEQGLVK